mmetsp:Transcript_108824/g.304687  ORF Transcript_108824/g.304687 Transcript_108824/m.304687 type:complete len:510 (-) Transcript_108824:69-1598(-)
MPLREWLPCWACRRELYPPIGRRGIWAVYLIVFVDICHRSLVTPLLPMLVTSFGGDPSSVPGKVALMNSVTQGVEAFLMPLLGSLSDSYGRRSVMMIATLSGAVSALSLGFADTFLVALCGRVIRSVGGHPIAVGNAFMADIASPEDRAEYMTKVTAFWGAGFMVGPGIGFWLYDTFGMRTVCCTAALVSLTNSCLVAFVMKESRQRPEAVANEGGAGGARPASPTAQAQEPAKMSCLLWTILCSNMFLAPIQVVFDTFTNLYVSGMFFDGDAKKGAELFTRCMTIIGGSLLLIPIFVYRQVLGCVGFNGVIVLAAPFALLGMTGNVLAQTPSVFLWTTLLWAIGFQLFGSSHPVLIARLASPAAFGKTFGMYMSIGNIARVFGPVALAPLYAMNPRSIFVVMTISTAILLVMTMGVAVATSTPPSEGQTDDVDLAGVKEKLTDPQVFTRAMSTSSESAVQQCGNFIHLAPALNRPAFRRSISAELGSRVASPSSRSVVTELSSKSFSG